MLWIEIVAVLQNRGTHVFQNCALPSRPWKTYNPWLQITSTPCWWCMQVRGFSCVCLGMVVEATHEYIYRNLQEILRN